MDPATDLSPERVAEMLDRGEAELVDVRTDAEWEAGRIAGARHLPLDRLSAEASGLEGDRPLVFVCRVGERSGMAADALRGAGREAYNLAGGLVAWSAKGLPLEPEGAQIS